MHSVHILHLEDNAADAELIRIILEDAFEKCRIDHVQNCQDFENALHKNKHYDIVLSDYNVPGLLELDSLKLSKRIQPFVPVIYVSGAIGEESAVEMLKNGATDYVLKNKLQKLPLAIERALREILDRNLVEENEKKLKTSDAFKASVLNAIKAQIIVINDGGFIIETNNAWEHFIGDYCDCFGDQTLRENNYFSLLKKMLLDTHLVEEMLENIRAVIERKQSNYQCDLEFFSCKDKVWFTLDVSQRLDERGAVIIVRNITRSKLMNAWSNITANIAQKITTEETSVPKVFELTHQELNNYMPAKNFFGVLREDVHSIEVLYFVDEKMDLEIPHVRKSGNGLTEYLLEKGEPLWLRGDEFETFEAEENVSIFGEIPKSCIAAPLFMEDTVIGVIACTSYDDENAFQDFHLSILSYVARHIGIFIDKIEAQEDRNRIITVSEDLICIMNSDGYLRYANPACENHLGYSLDELLTIKASDLIAPEDERARKILFQKLKSGDRSFKFKSKMKAKNGESLYISWTMISQEKDNFFYCSGRNVSEQHIIQQRIEESERRYRGLFERMSEGIIHSDVSGKILTVNPGLCKILGYQAEELIGELAYEKLHTSATGHMLKKKIESRKMGIPGSYETTFLRKDGEEVWTHVSVTPDYDPEGNFIGVMTIIMDVNERKRAEMEAAAIKEAFTRELEDKVNERTLELENAHKKLAESLEKEKELSRLKSRFVSTASHQFRTPLSVIQSSIGILSLQMENMSGNMDVPTFQNKFDKAYTRIKDQIEWMTDLMNDVLVLGKINEGNFTIRMHSCDLIELCKSVIQNFDDANGKNRIKFTVQGKKRLVETDKQLFQHALSNLASNAVKYTPNGSPPEMQLIFRETSVEITIMDKGIGIPADELQHLFEPFYRATNAKEYSGTGLGTSITKEYIELIGGCIDVTSAIGQGTKFSITLKN